MKDYDVVVDAWEAIGKTPHGKVVIDDMMDALLNEKIIPDDQMGMAVLVGARNSFIEILGLLRGKQ